MSGASRVAEGLLPTKLFIPQLEPDVLARARLLDMLVGAEGTGMILVSAPAGSGKTTLAADWVRRSGSPAGWISLDETDDEPYVFLDYLIEAAGSIAPAAPDRARALLRAAPPASPDRIAGVLVGDLVGARAAGTLVIDDYHTISDAAIHRVLEILVTHLPLSMTLVVITRSDPPLPLARMRVRRQLVEVREADLRFDAVEAGEFVRRFSGQELPRHAVAALTARTEGWAAGLQLAGLALRRNSDPEGFVAEFTGTHAFVADYLTDEVLGSMPDEHQDFVIRSSLLDRLSGPLCDALLERDGSQALIEELARANLFLVPLDAERRWFRYHHLFADLLRRRCAELGRREQRLLLGRAAEWCALNGAVDEAIRYAARAGDMDRAAALVAEHGIQALAAGEAFKALRWIQLIPDELVSRSPDHCVIAAWSHSLKEQHERIGPYAALALDRLSAGERPHDCVDGVDLHARLLRIGAVAPSRLSIDDAIPAIMQTRDEATQDNLPLRASAELMAGNLLRIGGRYSEGLAANRRALDIAIRADSHLLRLAAITGLAQIELIRGGLDSAIAAAQTELDTSRTYYEALTGQLANICAILACAHLQKGEVDLAEEALARGRSALGESVNSSLHWPGAALTDAPRDTAFHSSAPAVHFGLVASAGVRMARGEHAAVLDSLQTLEATVLPGSERTRRVVIEALRTRCLVALGERTRLQKTADTPPDGSTECAYWDDVRELTRIHRAVGAGDAHTACALLEPLLARLDAGEPHLGRAEALVLHAIACSQLGRRDAAVRSVAAALELTAPCRRIGPWLDAGTAVLPLLERVVADPHAEAGLHAHATALLSLAGSAWNAAAASDATSLTQKELAILRFIAAGRSNKQIANALYLAVGTVKKHTHNIYSKLGVSSRTQAIRAGREQGLITDLAAE